jgi:hypothetical protein
VNAPAVPDSTATKRRMQTLVLDTNAIVKKLESRGFSRTQAEGVTEALAEFASPLVTKSDIELALAKQTTTIITWVTGALLAQGALVVSLIQYLK